MPVRFRCPHCQVVLSISKRKAGAVVNCVRCKGQVQVPEPPLIPPGIPVRESEAPVEPPSETAPVPSADLFEDEIPAHPGVPLGFLAAGISVVLFLGVGLVLFIASSQQRGESKGSAGGQSSTRTSKQTIGAKKDEPGIDMNQWMWQHGMYPDMARRPPEEASPEPSPGEKLGSVFGIGVMLAIGLLFYFVPTMIALFRGHQNAAAIIAVNILLGWSFIGWVAAPVWSLTEVRSRHSYHYHYHE